MCVFRMKKCISIPRPARDIMHVWGILQITLAIVTRTKYQLHSKCRVAIFVIFPSYTISFYLWLSSVRNVPSNEMIGVLGRHSGIVIFLQYPDFLQSILLVYMYVLTWQIRRRLVWGIKLKKCTLNTLTNKCCISSESDISFVLITFVCELNLFHVLRSQCTIQHILEITS